MSDEKSLTDAIRATKVYAEHVRDSAAEVADLAKRAIEAIREIKIHAESMRDSATAAAELADQAIEAIKRGDWDTALQRVREAAALQWQQDDLPPYKDALSAILRARPKPRTQLVLHCHCGDVHDVPWDTTEEVHPHVFSALDCESPAELKEFIDDYDVDDFFSNRGMYLGPDDYGIGLNL